ncbi:MAG: glycosyltransferase family 2 protein [Actinomycetota bacterium]|nr:glycosyltransferase family 2 protein [Actinomycetota bacterium]
MKSSAPAPLSADGLEPHDRGVPWGTSEDDLVSVVIPARNEAANIASCIESVLGQTQSHLEVLVVDSGSTDETALIVRRYAALDPRVRLLTGVAGNIPKTLNSGLRAARGRWLVRVDAHSTVPPEYIEKGLVHLRTGRWGGVGGRKNGVGITPTGRVIAAAMASRFGVGDSTYHHGTRPQEVDHIPFGMYPTALLRELGGWDERLLSNEDFELDFRLSKSGHRLLFDPELEIRWQCRQTLSALFSQYLRYGRSKPAVAALHPESMRIRHLIPPLFIGWLVLTFLISMLNLLLALALLSAYLVPLVVAASLTARKVKVRGATARAAGAFAAMHVGWGLGFWEGLALLLARKATAAKTLTDPKGRDDQAIDGA